MKGQGEGVRHVGPQEFSELIDNGTGILLDVRTPNEFNNGHIEGAKLMNFYAPDFASQLLELPKSKPIYIYCNVGIRSSRAAGFLVSNGYQKVYNLQQGILVWHRQGYPVFVDPDARPDMTDAFSPNDFDALLKEHSLVFVDFYAPWCAPCRQMMPMIDSLKIEYHGKVEVVKVNTDVSRELLSVLEISAIPYFMMFVNQKPVFTHTGMISRKKITALFQNYIK